PSLMSRAWAGAARAMPAVASRAVRVRVSCMVFTLGCCCLGAFRAGWRQLAQAAAAEIFSQARQDADQVIVHGMARPYGVAIDNGGQDAFVLLVRRLPDLGGDEVFFQAAEYRTGGAQLPDVRNGGSQRGIAASIGNGAMEGAIVCAGRICQRHGPMSRLDRRNLRGRTALGGERHAFGLV